MAKTDRNATLAEINKPAPKATGTRNKSSDPDRRTVAPTPKDAKGDETEDESVVAAAREAAAGRAEEAKQKAAEVTEEHADYVKEASESFDPNSYAKVATDRLAEGLNDAARSIQDTDLTALADDVTAFARRQPLMFFGGAALLGFAAARVLKASERAERHNVASSRVS